MSTYVGNQTFNGIRNLAQTPGLKLLNALVLGKQTYDDFARVKSIFGSNATALAANLPDVPTLYESDGVTVIKSATAVMTDILATVNDFDSLWTYVETTTSILAHLRTVLQFEGETTGLSSFYAGEATYQTVKNMATTAAQRLVNALYECYAASDAFGRVKNVWGSSAATMSAKLPGIPTVYNQTDEATVADIMALFTDFDTLETYVSSSILLHLLLLAQYGG